MKIRLVSDLHIDVNETFGVSLTDDGENDVFTLIAGDICGTADNTISWLEKNVKKGAFCAGNHIVYSQETRENFVPIEDIKAKLHERFPLDSDVTFFDYDVGVMQKEIAPGILLVSDVMYTDYKLKTPPYNPDGNVTVNMHMAEPKMSGSYLNDFVFGFTRKKMYVKDKWDKTPDGIWHLKPKFYKLHHDKAWKAVQEIVKSNPDKEIILMTHHCLSPRCISKEYVGDMLNASYVSDKEKWIAAHPNIRLVFSGHVHHRSSFKVGKTLFVLNPLGYCRDTAVVTDPETGKEEMWTPNCYIDTDTWELTYEPYENDEWRAILASINKRLAGLMGLFF